MDIFIFDLQTPPGYTKRKLFERTFCSTGRGKTTAEHLFKTEGIGKQKALLKKRVQRLLFPMLVFFAISGELSSPIIQPADSVYPLLSKKILSFPFLSVVYDRHRFAKVEPAPALYAAWHVL